MFLTVKQRGREQFHLPPGSGKAHHIQVMTQLARLHQYLPTSLAAALRRLEHGVTRDTILIVTPRLDEPAVEAVKRLVRRGHNVMVLDVSQEDRSCAGTSPPAPRRGRRSFMTWSMLGRRMLVFWMEALLTASVLMLFQSLPAQPESMIGFVLFAVLLLSLGSCVRREEDAISCSTCCCIRWWLRRRFVFCRVRLLAARPAFPPSFTRASIQQHQIRVRLSTCATTLCWR